MHFLIEQALYLQICKVILLFLFPANIYSYDFIPLIVLYMSIIIIQTHYVFHEIFDVIISSVGELSWKINAGMTKNRH